MRKRQLLSLLVVPLLLLVAGCPLGSDPYRASIKGSSDVSQAVSSAIKITAQYYAVGTFNDGQKATAAKYLTVVTDCNFAFRKSVTDVHNAGLTGVSAFLPIADGFVNCVASSAPVSSDLKVSNVLKGVDSAIRSISVAVASAKGAK